MKYNSSTRRAISCVFLILSAVASSSSQTAPGKTATASISGKVTVKGKGVAGIVLYAHEQNEAGSGDSSHRATTDQIGSYRIPNLPAGTYVVSPVAPSLAVEDELNNNSVVLSEGEAAEGIDFPLVQGGVITGKITDADGKPLIEQYVTLLPLDSAVITGRYAGGFRTDDRGIYRAFGLRRGKYKVSVGQERSLPAVGGRSYRKTFHPSVIDAEKATVIEVTEGGEAKDVDIVVGRPLPAFKVSGRIVHRETGKPLPNLKYAVHQSIDDNSSHSINSNVVTNANGEFRVENVLPGKYAVFIVPEESGIRADSVSFEVVDRDITDLLIKAANASSLSGVVVLEGAEETAPAFNLRDLYVNASVETNQPHFDTPYSVAVNADGSFRVSGLRKGIAHFQFASRTNAAKQIALVRVERDGIVQPQGITLRDGEQVTGLRLVIQYLTGAIHGQIIVEGDELLPNSRMSVWITPLEERPGHQFTTGTPSPQLDSRRRFVAEGLAAGIYEVNVGVFDPGRQHTTNVYKQQVTVAHNGVSEVTVVIKPKP